MGCNKFTTSRAKAKDFLIQNSIIDKYNNIKDLKAFRKEVGRYRQHALKVFDNLPYDMFPIREDKNGLKVFFNEEFFYRIDAKRGIIYKDNKAYVDKHSDFSFIPMKKDSTILKSNNDRETFFSLDKPVKDLEVIKKVPKQLVALKQIYGSKLRERILSLKKRKRDLYKSADSLDVNQSEERRSIDKEIIALEEKLSDNEELIGKLNSSIEVTSPTILNNHIQFEIDKLNDLLMNPTIENDLEARNIADFLVELGKIRYSEFHGEKARSGGENIFHVLFDENEMFDKNKDLTLAPELVEKLLEWRKVGKDAIDQLEKNNKAAMLKLAKEHGTEHLTKLSDKKLEELLDTPLKNMSLYDMYMMDVTNGVFSENGIIPQLMKHILDSTAEQSLAKMRKYSDNIDRVVTMLKELFKKHPELAIKYGLKGKLGIKGIDWKELFLQLDEKGLRLLHHYNQEFFDGRKEIFDNLDKGWNEIKKIKNNKKKKNAAIKKLYNEHRAALKNHIEIINPNDLLDGDVYDQLNMYEAVIRTNFGKKMINITGKAFSINDMLDGIYNEKRKEKKLKIIETQHSSKRIDELKQNAKVRAIKYIEKRRDFIKEIVTEEEYKSGEYSSDSVVKILEFELANNPIYTEHYLNNNHKLPLDGFNNSWVNPKFNITIPKKQEHYSNRFNRLQENDTMYEAYSTFKEAWDFFESMLPEDEVKKLINGGLIFTSQSVGDFISQQDKVGGLKIIGKYKRDFMDNLINKITFKKNNEVSLAYIDSKGNPTYKIKPKFLEANRRKIKRRENVLTSIVLSRASEIVGKPIYSINKIPNKYKNQVFTDSLENKFQELDIPINKYRNKKGVWGNPQAAIKTLVQHQLALESSLDLPKILKLMTSMAQDYQARSAMLPIQMTAFNYYKQRLTKDITEFGEDATYKKKGLLAPFDNKRLTQMQSWFKINILGDLNKDEKALLAGKEIRKKIPILDKLAKTFGMKGVTFSNKYLTDAEKIEKKIIEEEIDRLGKLLAPTFKKLERNVPLMKKIKEAKAVGDTKLVKELTKQGYVMDKEEKKLFVQYKKLKTDLEKLGSFVSGSDIMTGIMYFLRFNGLGWNLKSGSVNFLEGQISNHMNFVRLGLPPEDLYTVTPQDLMKAKLIAKARGEEHIPEDTWKGIHLIEHYDIFKNNLNEIQKASLDEKRKKIKEVVNPFFITTQIEYMNQIPLMVGMMKNYEIRGLNKDGKMIVSNLFDALERVKNDKGELELKLKKEFRTESNIRNFEEMDGNDYFSLKSWINKALKDGHGDYDPNSSTLAKSTIASPLLLFKSWLPRAVYTWLGTEQYDIFTGMSQKGKLRSLSPASAISYGIAAGIMVSPLTGVITASMGALAISQKLTGGKVLGGSFGIQTTMGLASELWMDTKIIMKKMLGFGISNSAGIFSKKIKKKYNAHTLQHISFRTGKKGDAYARLRKDVDNGVISEMDLLNYESNMQSISQLLIMFAMMLVIKGLMWDDDDDEDSGKRLAHNFLVNSLVNLSDQTASYSNPALMYKTHSETAIVKFMMDVGKTIEKASKVFKDSDIYTTGEHRGESKTYNQFSKTFLPRALKETIDGAVRGHISMPTLGVGAAAKKQYSPLNYDEWFLGRKTMLERALKSKRSIMRNKLSGEIDIKDKDEKEKVIRDKLRNLGFYPKSKEKEDLKNFEKIVDSL